MPAMRQQRDPTDAPTARTATVAAMAATATSHRRFRSLRACSSREICTSDAMIGSKNYPAHAHSTPMARSLWEKKSSTRTRVVYRRCSRVYCGGLQEARAEHLPPGLRIPAALPLHWAGQPPDRDYSSPRTPDPVQHVPRRGQHSIRTSAGGHGACHVPYR